ncbi:hypothetical protein FKM82_006699 [Ascaphus truei]
MCSLLAAQPDTSVYSTFALTGSTNAKRYTSPFCSSGAKHISSQDGHIPGYPFIYSVHILLGRGEKKKGGGRENGQTTPP